MIKGGATIILVLVVATRGRGAAESSTVTIPTVTFDCNRSFDDHDSCRNNGTCSENHKECQCPTDYSGYNCAVNTTNTIDCDPNECQNGGTCFVDESDNGAIFCHCPEAYFGGHCESQRVVLQCTHDRMRVKVVPFGGFIGSMYVLNQEEDDACVLDPNADMSEFSKEIEFDACGDVENETDASGDTLLSFRVLIQYDDIIVSDLDEELVFVCKLPKAGSDVDSDVLTPFEYNSENRNLSTQEVTERLQPVEITMTTLDGEPITEPQILGSEVQLNFRLIGGKLYKSFRVEQITVSNGRMDSKRQEMHLVKGGCVPKRSKRIVRQFSGDNTNEFSLIFKVFKLRYSDTLTMENTVRLCNDKGCEQAMCRPENDIKGLGRRRRDVQSAVTPNDQQSNKVYTSQLKVWYPSAWTSGNDQGELLHGHDGYHQYVVASPGDRDGFHSCLDNTDSVIISVSLVAIVMLLVAIVVFLCFRYFSKCSRVKNERTEIVGCDNKV